MAEFLREDGIPWWPAFRLPGDPLPPAVIVPEPEKPVRILKAEREAIAAAGVDGLMQAHAAILIWPLGDVQ